MRRLLAAKFRHGVDQCPVCVRVRVLYRFDKLPVAQLHLRSGVNDNSRHPGDRKWRRVRLSITPVGNRVHLLGPLKRRIDPPNAKEQSRRDAQCAGKQPSLALFGHA